jgi:hypothetical protein
VEKERDKLGELKAALDKMHKQLIKISSL